VITSATGPAMPTFYRRNRVVRNCQLHPEEEAIGREQTLRRTIELRRPWSAIDR
jgi:hypothetical protein